MFIDKQLKVPWKKAKILKKLGSSDFIIIISALIGIKKIIK